MDDNQLQRWAENEAAEYLNYANAETSYDKRSADLVVRLRKAYERGKEDAPKNTTGVRGLEKTEGSLVKGMPPPQHYNKPNQ